MSNINLKSQKRKKKSLYLVANKNCQLKHFKFCFINCGKNSAKFFFIIIIKEEKCYFSLNFNEQEETKC